MRTLAVTDFLYPEISKSSRIDGKGNLEKLGYGENLQGASRGWSRRGLSWKPYCMAFQCVPKGK